MSHPPFRSLSLATLLLVASACTPAVDTRGNMPPADVVETIKPGVTTRTQVSQILGSPSSVATFNDRTWYYIGRKTETVAFFQPELMDQQVLVVRFDDGGVVEDIEKRGMEAVRDVSPVERETPTAGHTLGFFEQLFGNIGRFSGQADKKPTNNGGITTTGRNGQPSTGY